MLKFLFSRFLHSLTTLIGVISLIFLLFHIAPGDPVRMMLGQRYDESSIQSIRRDLGLDLPIHLQYLRYLNELSPLSVHNTAEKDHFLYAEKDRYQKQSLLQAGRYEVVFKVPYLGRSYQSGRKVNEVISTALPASLILATTSICIALIIGILFGIFAALAKNSVTDRILLVLATMGMSAPSFFIAILISWFFGYMFSEYTGLNMTGSLYEVDDLGRGTYLSLSNLVLPAITLGIRPLSVIMQLMRSSLWEVMGQDYIRTARAKGLPEWKIVLRHGLKNSLSPVVTATSGWFAGMLAGAVFVEMIFDWKGLGWELVNSLQKYDMPVMMGAVTVISAIFVAMNVVVDITYAILDPRVKLTGA